MMMMTTILTHNTDTTTTNDNTTTTATTTTTNNNNTSSPTAFGASRNGLYSESGNAELVVRPLVYKVLRFDILANAYGEIPVKFRSNSDEIMVMIIMLIIVMIILIMMILTRFLSKTMVNFQ